MNSNGTQRKQSHKANTKEIVQISQLLSQHIIPDGNGRYVYEAGWSDSKIIRIVNEELHDRVVARIRLQLHGNMRQSSAHGPREPNTMGKRVARLERNFYALLKDLGVKEID